MSNSEGGFKDRFLSQYCDEDFSTDFDTGWLQSSGEIPDGYIRDSYSSWGSPFEPPSVGAHQYWDCKRCQTGALTVEMKARENTRVRHDHGGTLPRVSAEHRTSVRSSNPIPRQERRSAEEEAMITADVNTEDSSSVRQDLHSGRWNPKRLVCFSPLAGLAHEDDGTETTATRSNKQSPVTSSGSAHRLVKIDSTDLEHEVSLVGGSFSTDCSDPNTFDQRWHPKRLICSDVKHRAPFCIERGSGRHYDSERAMDRRHLLLHDGSRKWAPGRLICAPSESKQYGESSREDLGSNWFTNSTSSIKHGSRKGSTGFRSIPESSSRDSTTRIMPIPTSKSDTKPNHRESRLDRTDIDLSTAAMTTGREESRRSWSEHLMIPVLSRRNKQEDLWYMRADSDEEEERHTMNMVFFDRDSIHPAGAS